MAQIKHDEREQMSYWGRQFILWNIYLIWPSQFEYRSCRDLKCFVQHRTYDFAVDGGYLAWKQSNASVDVPALEI